MWFSLVIFILNFLRESEGQEILFYDVPDQTECKVGLRKDIDAFVINGTVGENFNQLVNLGWLPLIKIEVFNKDTLRFQYMCDVTIGASGLFCKPNKQKLCHCYLLDSITGLAHFTIRYPARMILSHEMLRASWENRNGTMYYSYEILSVPAIYDVTNVTLELKVNGNSGPNKSASATSNRSASCGPGLTPEVHNHVELCCSQSASPCYPRLSIDGEVVAKGPENCVKYTIPPQNDDYKMNMTLSYSVCNLKDFITAYSCVIGTNLTGRQCFLNKIKYCVLKLTLGIEYPLACLVVIICAWRCFRNQPGTTCHENNNCHLIMAFGVGLPLLCIGTVIIIFFYLQWQDENEECPGEEDTCKLILGLGIGVPMLYEAVMFAGIFIYLWWKGRKAPKLETPVAPKAKKKKGENVKMAPSDYTVENITVEETTRESIAEVDGGESVIQSEVIQE